MSLLPKRYLVLALVTGLLLPATFAAAQLSRVTRPQVALPEGPLRSVILRKCVSCHGIDDYAFHALTRERWETLLDEKHQNLPMQALAASEHELLLDYLSENFGEDYSPFPRAWLPPEIDTFHDDESGRAALDAVCTECHELDRVYETRATLERWRSLLLEMRARGASMDSDEDMERMAEWLSRVQSANTFE
jgi:cytochrome c553